MASFDVCYNFMMDAEDAPRAYKIVPDAPPGAHAVSGINSAAFPAEFDAISKLMISERGSAIEQFYRSRFWNRSFDGMNSDELAKRVFDAAVNMGSGTAAKILQRVLGVTPDGVIGPATVVAANSGDHVAAFISARKQHYISIASANPAKKQYLKQWLARASR